jgi:acyl-CoA synthetase (NDP forming)
MNAFDTLDRMIHPKSLAIIGASATPGKFGWIYPLAQKKIGYEGKLYPINDHVDEIHGFKTYPSLKSLPEVPDLVVFTVPARFVAGYLREASDLGVPGAVVMSAGFGEEGGVGEEMERELSEIAQNGIRIIGPNCFGTYSPKLGVTMIPGAGFSREVGPVGYFSQSGGLLADLGQMARSRGVRFSAAISYGNAVDVNEIDLLQYFAEDEKTGIIAAYIEGVREGRRFFELLREITPKKPVVIWKAGSTPSGQKAARSHTGALGGEYEIWESMLEQAGVVTVRGLEEMLDILTAFITVHPRGGRKITIVGGGGGLAVESADLAELSGLVLPPFPDDVREKIGALLQGAGSSPTNPVDAGNPIVHPSVLTKMMHITASLDEIDTIFVVQIPYHINVLIRLVSQMEDQPITNFSYAPELAKGAKEIIDTYNKPVIGVFLNTSTTENDLDMDLEMEWRRARTTFLDVGVPVYPTIERAMNALDKVVRYREFLEARGKTKTPSEAP